LDSLNFAFKAPAADLESIWLKKVREYHIPDELTPKAGDVPQLMKAVSVPEIAKRGAPMQLRFLIEDAASDLIPENVFVKDERTGLMYQTQAFSEKNEQFFAITIPVDVNCPAGQHRYQVTAIDESGNLRRFSGNYSVGNEQ
jgi:hypothetical protein